MWDWQFTWSIMPEILRGLQVTLIVVFFGMLLALVLGLVWAICRRSSVRFVSWPVTAVVEFVRSTPLLVQIYFVYYVLWPNLGVADWPLAIGICAVGVYYSAYTAEVYRAGIEGVLRGQWEAARALNFTPWQTYRHVVLPQAIPPVIPALGNYLIAMFKDTPLISAIAVLEMLQRAKNLGNEHFRYLEPITMVGVIYLVLSLVAAFGVDQLRRRLHVQRV